MANSLIPPAPEAVLKRRRWFLVAGIVIVAVLVLLVYLLRSVVFIVLASSFLAYALHPLVDFLGRHHFKRTIAAGLVVGLSVLLLLAFLVILIPTIVDEYQSIRDHFPTYSEQVTQFYLDKLTPWVKKYLDFEMPRYMVDIRKLITNELQESLPIILDTVRKGIAEAFTRTLSAAGILLSLAIIPFFTFFFVRDYHKLLTLFLKIVPARYHAAIFPILHEIDDNLSHYFRGQMVVLLILILFYTIGLQLIGIEAAVALGALSGFLFLLPYVGSSIAYCLTMFLTLLNFTHWTTFIWITALYIAATQLEGFVLTPRITGKRVGLAPWQVILLIMVFATLFGIIGIIIAIPSGAVLRIIGSRLWSRYVRTGFYHQAELEAPAPNA